MNNVKPKTRKGFGTSVLARAVCACIAIVLLCGTIGLSALAGSEHSGIVSPETTVKNYEIAVVYDNSGSMAADGRWYKAKYAMEIFASMIDFNNGDKLTVFPMHPVTVDGDRESSTVEEVEIRTVGDIDKVHNMYTPNDGNTPFETVENAYSYLSGISSRECWLIILTDGDFTGYSSTDTRNALLDMAKYVNIQFIPFGTASLQPDESNGFFASDTVSNESELQKALIGACNQIFQRDVLDGYLNGDSLTIDLSMKKVIVFAQGKGAEIISLKDSNGKIINKLIDSGKRKYSELGSGGIDPYPQYHLPNDLKDQTGQVVTFDACAKGTYTLEYRNATDIQIFYEPDVTMVIDFINNDGIVEDFSDGEIYEGDYTYQVQIIDTQTGEDVSDHKLLGGHVDINSKVKYSHGSEFDLSNGDTVTFKEGNDVEFDISATYLERYHLRSLDSLDIDWGSINIKACSQDLAIDAVVEQDDEWYALTEKDNWKPIKVSLTLDGAPLTDEQLEATVFDFAFEDETPPYRVERLYGESAINIYIGSDDDGNYVEPVTDDYKLKIKASTIDIYGKTATAEDEAKFTIDEKTYDEHRMWCIINALVVLAVLAFIISIPARPSQIYLKMDNKPARLISKGNKLKAKCATTSRASFEAFKAKIKTQKIPFKNSWLFARVFKTQWVGCYITDLRRSAHITNLNIISEANTGDCELYEGKIIEWYEDGALQRGTIQINHKN